MWRLSWAIAAVMTTCIPAQAAPLAPVAGGTLDGIPLAQAMAATVLLGKWDGQPLAGGHVRLVRVMSRKPLGECDASGLDDADICARYRLFVSANGETSIPVDFALFRGPETLSWELAKDAKPVSDHGKFNLCLSALEMKKTATGFGWEHTLYVLHVGGDLKTGDDGYGHFVFDVDLEKLPEHGTGCGS